MWSRTGGLTVGSSGYAKLVGSYSHVGGVEKLMIGSDELPDVAGAGYCYGCTASDEISYAHAKLTIPEVQEELVDIREVPVRVLLRRVATAHLGDSSRGTCVTKAEAKRKPAAPYLDCKVLRRASRARRGIEHRGAEHARLLADALCSDDGGRGRIAARASLRFGAEPESRSGREYSD